MLQMLPSQTFHVHRFLPGGVPLDMVRGCYQSQQQDFSGTFRVSSQPDIVKIFALSGIKWCSIGVLGAQDVIVFKNNFIEV